MPIHLIWGDDEAARSRAVEALVKNQVDPSLQNGDLISLFGTKAKWTSKGFTEMQTVRFDARNSAIASDQYPVFNKCGHYSAGQLGS